MCAELLHLFWEGDAQQACWQIGQRLWVSTPRMEWREYGSQLFRVG